MKKFLLLSAVALTATAAFAQTDYLNSDYYVIGTNVNGQSWALAEESAKFEATATPGVFEWNGEELGTGFKVNNGTWDSDDFNFGSAGTDVVLGEAYYLGIGGSTGNMAFAPSAEGVEFSSLKNPKIVLDVTDPENINIVVTGEESGLMKWYFTGNFNDWAIDDAENAIEMEQDGDVCKATADIVADPELGYATFKVTKTGWALTYGSNDEATVAFGAGVYEGTLDEVAGEAGACPFWEDGKWDITWNPETAYIVFSQGEEAVSEIEAASSEAVYFNLQGVRVANPENGLFIQTVNGKATKVLIRK